MGILSEVRAICTQLGALHPDPSVDEATWAAWLAEFRSAGGIVETIPCPECDGRLVRKHGKYGDFLSCVNYPDCRHSEDIPA